MTTPTAISILGLLSLIAYWCYLKHRYKHSNDWVDTQEALPPLNTPVLVAVHGYYFPLILERRWEQPTFEETFDPFWYWDDPLDDGKEFGDNVYAWKELSELPYTPI